MYVVRYLVLDALISRIFLQKNGNWMKLSAISTLCETTNRVSSSFELNQFLYPIMQREALHNML